MNNAASKRVAEACELFGVTDTNKIPSILWAIGIRETCSRCAGSGRHSYCQRYGDTCFKCGGKGQVPSKLTKASLALAQTKVAAGELDAARARARERAEARRAIAPLVARAEEIYHVIGAEYGAAYSLLFKNGKDSEGNWVSPVCERLFRAQTMNNSIFYGLEHHTAVSRVQDLVQRGRMGALEGKIRLEECVRMLEDLLAAWRA